ncbi:MAG: YdcF family protein, partial [Acidobacteria bacterium]|nr:YdcF family protein [Acidobacteriota bacterium]
ILTNDGQQGGWSNEERRNPFFVERAAKELEASGVPAAKIEILPQVVTSTYEEATLLREYVAAQHLRSVLIVTSAYHTRRALWTLRRAFAGSGIELGIESPPAGWQTPAPATWWLHARGWQLVAGEYVKLLYYHLRY